MDFSISQMLIGTSTTETAGHASKGSIRWLAPELVCPSGRETQGDVIHTKESDIWALGMVYLVRGLAQQSKHLRLTIFIKKRRC